jgi:hypothetical protein
LFNEFYNGDMDVKRINYGIITLLPKVKEVEKYNISDPLFVCLIACLNGSPSV